MYYKFLFLGFLIFLMNFQSENHNSLHQKNVSIKINIENLSDTIPTKLEQENTPNIKSDTFQLFEKLLHENYPDYKLFKVYTGFLNEDKKYDAIIISEILDTASHPERPVYNRRMFIYLQTDLGKFKIHTYNDNIIGCSDCGGMAVGDPFQDILIANQAFEIDLVYGSCMVTIYEEAYQYQSVVDSFQLMSTSKKSFHCGGKIEPKNVFKSYPKNLEQEYFNENYRVSKN